MREKNRGQQPCRDRDLAGARRPKHERRVDHESDSQTFTDTESERHQQNR